MSCGAVDNLRSDRAGARLPYVAVVAC